MSSSAPEPPVRRPDVDWDRGTVAVREPAEAADTSLGKPGPPPRSLGLTGQVRRVARFLYRLLTESP